MLPSESICPYCASDLPMATSTPPAPELAEGTLAVDFVPKLEKYLRSNLAVDSVQVEYSGFVDSTATDGHGPLPVERSEICIILQLGQARVQHVVNGLALARAVSLSRYLSHLASTLAQQMGMIVLRRQNAPTWSELATNCTIKP